jgi:hypothetical protein
MARIFLDLVRGGLSVRKAVFAAIAIVAALFNRLLHAAVHEPIPVGRTDRPYSS